MPVADRHKALAEAGKDVAKITEERAKTDYGRLKGEYLEKTSSPNSVVLNTDEWRDLFPEYIGTNAMDTHQAASNLNKQLFADTLKEMKGKGNGKMMILAGGGGSGKGSACGKHFDESQYPIRLDQVSDNLKKLEDKLAEAQAAGFEPEYVFVDRHPVDAWDGVVSRATNARKKDKLARTVPLSIALKANLEARTTALELLKKNPGYKTHIVDNNHGHQKAKLISDRGQAIAFLEAQNHDHGALLKKLEGETLAKFESGEIDHDIAEGLLNRKLPERTEKASPEKAPVGTKPAKPPTKPTKPKFG